MRAGRWFEAGVVGAVLAGCGPPAEIAQVDLPRRMADALCDRTQECMRGPFEAQYFGMNDCRAHVEAQLDALVAELVEAGDDCPYDATQAGAAYADLVDMTCERFYEGAYVESISEIWGCAVFVPGPVL